MQRKVERNEVIEAIKQFNNLALPDLLNQLTGFDFHVTDPNTSFTLMEHALRWGNLKAMEMLHDFDLERNKKINSEIMNSAHHIPLMIHSVNTQTGLPLLHQAVVMQTDANRFNTLLVWFANLGLDINRRDNEKRTALMHAILNDKKTFIAHLISFGADIKARDANDKSILDYIKEKYDASHPQIVTWFEELLKREIDISRSLSDIDFEILGYAPKEVRVNCKRKGKEKESEEEKEANEFPKESRSSLDDLPTIVARKPCSTIFEKDATGKVRLVFVGEKFDSQSYVDDVLAEQMKELHHQDDDNCHALCFNNCEITDIETIFQLLCQLKAKVLEMNDCSIQTEELDQLAANLFDWKQPLIICVYHQQISNETQELFNRLVVHNKNITFTYLPGIQLGAAAEERSKDETSSELKLEEAETVYLGAIEFEDGHGIIDNELANLFQFFYKPVSETQHIVTINPFVPREGNNSPSNRN